MYINVPCTKMVHRTIVVTHIYNYINAYTYISILAFDHASKTIYNTYIYNFLKYPLQFTCFVNFWNLCTEPNETGATVTSNRHMSSKHKAS